MPKRLMDFFFGHTPDLRRKHIHQLLLAVGLALLFCAIIGVLLYVINMQGRI
jgi:hypothetical protein